MFIIQFLFNNEWCQTHLAVWDKNWERAKEPAIYHNLPSATAALDRFKAEYPEVQFRVISQSLVSA